MIKEFLLHSPWRKRAFLLWKEICLALLAFKVKGKVKLEDLRGSQLVFDPFLVFISL